MNKILRISVPVLFSILAFGVTAPSAFAAAPGDVIINEFSSHSSSDWVELLNTTSSDISLNGWKIQDVVFSSPPGTANTPIGVVTIPAHGIVVIDITTGGLNQDGDVITLFDNSENQISAVSYGNQTNPPAPNHVNAPGSGQSASLNGTTWSVATSPTRGWFNNAVDFSCPSGTLTDPSGGTTPPTLSSIATCLASSPTNVATNMGSLADPSAATNLYFEKSVDGNPVGKISFAGPLNLTDSSTVNYLKAIGAKMEASKPNGAVKVGLNTSDNSAFSGMAGTVKMYGVPGNVAPSLIIRNNDGDIVTPGGDNPTITPGTFDSGAQTYEFSTTHFTTFETKIAVTGITVNASSDTVVNTGTLTMTASTTPSNATDSSVTWSVAPLAGGTATIDAATGVLTATGVGTVTVTATAHDGSGITGTKVITITAPNADIVYVDASKSDDSGDGLTAGTAKKTIQAGIAAVNAGGTVNVAAGLYSENVTISKALTLTGAASTTVTVTAAINTNSVFTVATSSVNISGFTLTGTLMSGNNGYAGIKLNAGVQNSNIHDNILSNNQYGLLMFGTYGDTALGNNTIANNTASNCTVSGIEMQGTNGNTFTNNTANNSNSGSAQGFRIANSKHNTFTGNTANSNVYGFYMVKDASHGGTGSDYNTFTNNTANLNTNHGMYVTNGDHNTFTGNTVSSNLSSGFRMKYADGITNLTLSNNIITGNVFGINIDSSVPDITTWTVNNNNISENTTYNISNSNTGTLNAIHNWWGSSILATIQSKISGTVTINPWYTDSGMTTLVSSDKAITSFSFASPSATGVITESSHTVAISVPFGTNVVSLSPTVTVSSQATTSPASGVVQDFTNPVTYTVTAGDSSTQTYTVTVTVAANPDIASVAAAKSALAGQTLHPTEGVNTTVVSMAQGIANESSSGVTVMATTSTNSQVAADGAITYGSSQVTGNVTFTLTKGVVSDIQTASVVVPAHILTDAESVASDKGALVNNLIKGTNAEDLASVTANLALVTSISGGAGSVISWASNNTAIATTTGTVTRPAYGVGNAAVTLTATISKGSIHDTKIFTATVLESPNSAKAITAFNFSSGTGVINETNHTISVNVPNGTAVTALIPTITITGASVNPASGASHNFTATSTYTVTAANGTTQDYVVTVTILAATQVAPDNTGAASVDATKPQVVITNPTQDVAVTISSGTTDAKIDVSSFVSSGTGDIPKITITSTAGAGNAAAATIEIPATKVTSADATWNGVIAAPTVTTVDLPATSGETKTLSTAIEVGFSSAKLSFDKAVRILLPNQAGKRAGYSRPGADFTEITNTCSADDQTTMDTALAADSECKMDAANGTDLVIWTKHFTKFAAYTQTANAVTTGGGGGNACGYGFVWNSSKMSCSQIVATVATPTPEQGQVLGAAVYNFAKNLSVGSRGADVTTLQQFLIDSGYAIPAGATGYFGTQTRTAVIAFQKAKGIAPVGAVGPLTRAELNKGSSGSTLTLTQVNSIADVLQAFGADESIITKVRAALAK